MGWTYVECDECGDIKNYRWEGNCACDENCEQHCSCGCGCIDYNKTYLYYQKCTECPAEICNDCAHKLDQEPLLCDDCSSKNKNDL